MHQKLDSIDKVKQAFTEWREQRPRKCPIPDYLWDMVGPLLDEYPHAMITRFSGTVFAFSNRASTSVKLLVYDASGFWLCQKRFSKGRLAWWPNGSGKTAELRASELMILLAQGDPQRAAIPEDWKPVNQAAKGISPDKVCW